MADATPLVDQPISVEPTTRVPFSLVRIDQTSTRGDCIVSLGENFRSSDIDFKGVLPHLKIHLGEDAAGSQFNGDIFASPEDVVVNVSSLLPEQLQYDQHGRAELTLEVADGQFRPMGWSGVSSVEELCQRFPDAIIQQQVRTPGGEETNDGAWYPEMVRTESGWSVAVDEAGKAKNPHGKFEPKANIASLPAKEFNRVAATNKITVIIQKDGQNVPRVLTIFPGDNAPAYPAKIDTADFKSDTTGDTPETRFWKQHVFVIRY